VWRIVSGISVLRRERSGSRQMSGDGSCIKGGRHHRQPQIGPSGELQPAKQGESEVRVQVALVDSSRMMIPASRRLDRKGSAG